jgi:hypothetical protein
MYLTKKKAKKVFLMLGLFPVCFNVYNENNLRSCCYCIPECDDGPGIHVPICPTILILEGDSNSASVKCCFMLKIYFRFRLLQLN